jgi:mannose-6-phosphate isomerase-like protein (cupin superfamily)
VKKTRPPISLDEAVLEEFPWGEIRWIWNSQIDKNAEQTLGHVIIKPGEKNTFHGHPNCEELLYMLTGECDHWVGDEKYHLKPGMTICIPRGLDHYAEVTSSEPMRALIFYSSPDRETNVKE